MGGTATIGAKRAKPPVPRVPKSDATAADADVPAALSDADARTYKALSESGVIDAAFYRATYPDAAGADVDPILHFARVGLHEGRQPNRYFDVGWYLSTNHDVKASGAPPLLHYLSHGDREGRRPGPWFATQWYRGRYAIPVEMNALGHYVQHRLTDELSPVPEFDVRFYAEVTRDLVVRPTDLFADFLLAGLRAGRPASAAIDAAAFAEKYLGGAIGENPFTDFPSAERPTVADQAAPVAVSVIATEIGPAVIARVTFAGYHRRAGGWLICASGLGIDRIAYESCPDAVLCFEGGERTGAAALVQVRPGGGGAEHGIVLFVATPDDVLRRLLSVEVGPAAERIRFLADADTRPLDDQALVSALEPMLEAAPVSKARDLVLTSIRRRPFGGDNTLDQLAEPVLMQVDEAIFCPPDGLVLIGWWLYAPASVAAIRVRCGAASWTLNPADCVATERPDVATQIGRAAGMGNLTCGFVAFVPDLQIDDGPLYIEVETTRGEIGYRTIPAPHLTGMPALRRMLNVFDVNYDAVRPAFDKVIGPAFMRLNQTRMQDRPTVDEICFGTPPATPEFSIIVPLYGRIEFIEYQLALIALGGSCRDAEFIYVLDDPPKRVELLALAESVHLRFGLSLRLLLLSHNMGFAPACNVGLEHARGRLVCFLNSDVFPETEDWLQRLGDRLDAEPDIGAIGPLLLFEDGGVQHEGMTFEPNRALGNLMFPSHRRKGWRPDETLGLVREEVITGACIVMSRTLAIELGGFSEVYAIGDFEDTDLCLQIGQRGLVCAVDHRVRLYHLERKSQDSPEHLWRRNLTLCNAWCHSMRWFPDERPHAAGPAR